MSRILRTLTLDGLTYSIAEWADKTGLKQSVIYNRLAKGWSAEEALTTQTGRPSATKDDAKHALNDMERNQLPAQLEKLIQPGAVTHYYGEYFRTNFRKEFNDWYEKVYVPNHTKR